MTAPLPPTPLDGLVPLVPGLVLMPEEAGAYTRRSANVMKKLRHRGEGPAYVTDGQRVIYRSEDVLAWLDTLPRTVPTKTAAALANRTTAARASTDTTSGTAPGA